MKHIILSLTAAAVLSAQAGLVGHWKFDEGAGTTAQDSSGNNRNAVITNGTWVEGKRGSAVSFSGSWSFARAAIVDIPGSITMCAWVKPAAMPEREFNELAVVARSGYHNSLGCLTDGSFFFSLWNIENKNAYATAPKAEIAGVWHHIAGTYNEESRAVTVYVNGTAKKTVTLPAGGGVRKYEPVLYFGVGAPGSSKYASFFPGDVDEVKLFSRALSADEIQAEYASY